MNEPYDMADSVASMMAKLDTNERRAFNTLIDIARRGAAATITHDPIGDRVRLIRVSTPFLGLLGVRDEEGNRITAEWGEPDQLGVYCPLYTRHVDDNLAVPLHREIEYYRRSLEQILAKPVTHFSAMRRIARAALAAFQPKASS